MARIGKEKIWVLREDGAANTGEIELLAREVGLSPVTARLLYHRGYRNAEAVTRFLSCADTLLHSPFLLRDMDRAVARILRALERRERIVIYGDYDVDGVTSVTVLYLYLKSKGADVSYYIPSRSGEGYGLSVAAIDKLAESGVTCVITVDTGVTACDETVYARERGIDMVITDHHECRAVLPDAVAVVNPHRPDCPYPFKELAGVGVVFKLVGAIEATLGAARGETEIQGVRRVADEYADLVAIGTIADVMPITDENRLIVTKGLRLIENTKRAGLAALVAEASAPAGGVRHTRKKQITSTFIGFGIAPRINAAGRMYEASIAVDLLLCEDEARAHELAVRLCEINRARQQEENQIAEQALAEIEQSFDPERTRVLVLGNDHWRQGIIGIVASRLTERYGLPSILISFDGAANGAPDDLGKGSGRSVKGVNLVEALGACEDLLVKFGGHELAAGLTLRRDALDAFRTRINAYVAERLPSDGASVQLEADLELEPRLVSVPLAEEIARLEPFGIGNPVPHFVLRDMTLERVTELGGGKHLKLQLGRDGVSHTAMLFSTTREQLPYLVGDRIDVLGTLNVNEFRDVRTVQIVVQDHKRAKVDTEREREERERYLAVRAGAPHREAEGFLPTRDDCARVYTLLRREFRQGRDTFSVRTLLAMLNASGDVPIGYGKLKYVLEIFHELRICGVEETECDVYRFDIFFNASKSSIDRSAILRKLKQQMINENSTR